MSYYSASPGLSNNNITTRTNGINNTPIPITNDNIIKNSSEKGPMPTTFNNADINVGTNVSSLDTKLLDNFNKDDIPSPPLSPKLSASKTHPDTVNSSPSVTDPNTINCTGTTPTFLSSSDRNITNGTSINKITKPLVLNPDWSRKNYTSSLMTFLSHYRCFENKYHHPTSTLTNSAASNAGLTYKRANTSRKAYASDPELTSRVYRTRLRTGNTKNSGDINGTSAPQTPVASPELKRATLSPPFSASSSRHHFPTIHAKGNATLTALLGSNHEPNMGWEKLPDYSPSTKNLKESNKNALKVEWKGSSMDLRNDPLRNKLHPAELVLAQILRLPCDLYLDSKRRLFIEKVHRLKNGLPFRRTDAQKACRIDVNKASRLYAAYEKVGWLKDENFTKYLSLKK
ncbi:uncharacterized protein SCODWIG_00662 [Saccharomycodes ludwigii]|uniref:SWIRM domain-containing protein n=1 Tax=Saccharomycodes ludwigii TaxID=36035 RepID=A0A376B2N0_9ASCO|nr:hypothetical protein SCDLUD_000458 [Saccharomycodes ludwigii]KAH3902864.1 hypothetical protein SCDLUD_000458 [Saccharomycodes ludwigii]SSD58901.1 uncharacterized protein SCODWIG_00662 [Saccharomycodes ludwigii]